MRYESEFDLESEVYYIVKYGLNNYRVASGIVNKVCFTQKGVSVGIRGEHKTFVVGQRAFKIQEEANLRAKYMTAQELYRGSKKSEADIISLILTRLEYEIYKCTEYKNVSTFEQNRGTNRYSLSMGNTKSIHVKFINETIVVENCAIPTTSNVEKKKFVTLIKRTLKETPIKNVEVK